MVLFFLMGYISLDYPQSFFIKKKRRISTGNILYWKFFFIIIDCNFVFMSKKEWEEKTNQVTLTVMQIVEHWRMNTGESGDCTIFFSMFVDCRYATFSFYKYIAYYDLIQSKHGAVFSNTKHKANKPECWYLQTGRPRAFPLYFALRHEPEKWIYHIGFITVMDL